MDDSEPGKESSTETEKILVSLANPDTIEDMMNLSLVIRDTKLKDNLLALHVINDDSTSDNLRMQSKRYLEKAAMTTTAANVSLKQLTRYDLNIASGIIHSVKENEVTSIITGLHRKANITDSYFGNACRKPAERIKLRDYYLQIPDTGQYDKANRYCRPSESGI